MNHERTQEEPRSRRAWEARRQSEEPQKGLRIQSREGQGGSAEALEQTTVPGFERWQQDERDYVARVELARAQLAIDSALTPRAPRRAEALPLFDDEQPTLF